MSYYIGTHNECQQYNELVTFSNNFGSVTDVWATLVQHPNGVDFAIKKHPKHDSAMKEVNALPADWFVNE